MLKIGWFSTARGEGSRQLLKTAHQYIENGEIKGQIDFVFCTREPNESEQTDIFFEMVKSYKIPIAYLSFQKYKYNYLEQREESDRDASKLRIEYDREVMRLLKDYSPDICMLAGYMLIVGAEMCQKYNMINLHPALPGGPTGTWKEVIWKLIDNRAAETGIMIHLVTPELDRGPVITYCKYPITGDKFDVLWQSIGGLTSNDIQADQGENNELFRLIRHHGATRELPLIVLTLKALCNGDIRIAGGKLLDDNGQQLSGYDLTSQVDKMVSL